MKIIKIHNCGTCPYREDFSSATKTACGHLLIKVKIPYSNDRYVDPSKIAEFCPLE